MTQPRKHKKGRTPPMSAMGRNGDATPPGIPDDLEWSPDLEVYACSQHTNHVPQCDGTCESMHPDESWVNLANEGRAWARAGMSFFGIPVAYADMIPVAGLKVELFDLECWMEVLRELMGVDIEELQVKFREYKLTRLKEIREINEANVRKARLANSLGIVEKKILGPRGEQIG